MDGLTVGNADTRAGKARVLVNRAGRVMHVTDEAGITNVSVSSKDAEDGLTSTGVQERGEERRWRGGESVG